MLDIWLTLISIISPENGAMNESDDRGEKVVWRNTCQRKDQRDAFVLPTISLRKKDFDSHT